MTAIAGVKNLIKEGVEDMTAKVWNEKQVTALVKGKMEPSDLINAAEKYPTMKNAVLASTFESIPSDIQIIH
ncbi:MAG: hypothetical protein HFI68_11790 [Lachnospiraceae bacterium]|nr:hypothetical protein [Lachnospiraceae bacterium]